ncbi:MAG: sec-independent translocase [Actinomycetes bacterium]|jgi:sec-independent protein translocase protein TatB
MFNIGAGEFIMLAVLALILVGPDRLPHVAAEAAKMLKKVRAMSQTATAELRENLGPGFEDLQVSDLNPKKFIQKHLNEAMDGVNPAAEIAEIKNAAKIDPDLL